MRRFVAYLLVANKSARVDDYFGICTFTRISMHCVGITATVTVTIAVGVAIAFAVSVTVAVAVAVVCMRMHILMTDHILCKLECVAMTC